MILSILTFILGVFGSYLISRNFEIKTQIRMDINSLEIINDSIGGDNITLKCNGTMINTLTKTSIMLWNSGRKCITKDEILGDQRLKIEFFQGVEIFDCTNVKNNEDSNNISISKNDNIVFIDFDYLKPGNGAVIGILHNGDIDKEITPILNLKTYNRNDVIKVETSVGWKDIIRKKEHINYIVKIINTVLCFFFVLIATLFSVFVPLSCIKNIDMAMLVSLVLEFICGGLFILLVLYSKNSFCTKPKDLY